MKHTLCVSMMLQPVTCGRRYIFVALFFVLHNTTGSLRYCSLFGCLLPSPTQKHAMFAQPCSVPESLSSLAHYCRLSNIMYPTTSSVRFLLVVALLFYVNATFLLWLPLSRLFHMFLFRLSTDSLSHNMILSSKYTSFCATLTTNSCIKSALP